MGHEDDAQTVARAFIDRFGDGAVYWAMCRLSISDSWDRDFWRQIVSAIEETQARRAIESDRELA
jgi:hypothetical protein